MVIIYVRRPWSRQLTIIFNYNLAGNSPPAPIVKRGSALMR